MLLKHNSKVLEINTIKIDGNSIITSSNGQEGCIVFPNVLEAGAAFCELQFNSYFDTSTVEGVTYETAG